jgi:uncharacterized membrane protein YkoI
MTRFTLALLLSLLACSAQAQPWSEGGWRSAQNGTVTINDLMGNDDPRLQVTLDEAVAQVRRESGGRVLSAKTVRQNGMFVHRIKVLTPQKQVVIHEIEAGLTH